MAFLVVMPILAYALGSATYDAVSSYRDAGMIDRQNAAANNLIAGVYEILMERLATNNALQATDPAGGDVLKEIDVRRSVAVKKIGAAFDDLSAQDFPDKAALLAELKGAIEKANGYRSKADTAIKQPKAARDADTVKNLFVSLSELSTTSQKVWAAVLVEHQPARSRARAALQHPHPRLEPARHRGLRALAHRAVDLGENRDPGRQAGRDQRDPRPARH